MGDASLTTELGRVLVTGGSGFVGANLVTTLLDRGHQVRSFDRAPSPLPRHPQLEVVQGDITDAAVCAATGTEIAQPLLTMTNTTGRVRDPAKFSAS